MIAALTGRVTGRDERSLVLEVHGLAFRVFTIPRTIDQFSPGTEAKIITHLHVREDAVELYGFALASEQQLFEKLLTVSGVGPKVALGVLSAASVEDIEAAIAHGHPELLTKVSGVGKKTAERIIVDLRGKIERGLDETDNTLASVIQALINLGYSAKEAREAAAATAATLKVEERIKSALQRLGR